MSGQQEQREKQGEDYYGKKIDFGLPGYDSEEVYGKNVAWGFESSTDGPSLPPPPPSWLKGELSRRDAEALLRFGAPGDFLVRRSKNEYALSLVLAAGVYEHHRITKNDSGVYCLNGTCIIPVCRTLEAVVTHLSENEEDMTMTLTLPNDEAEEEEPCQVFLSLRFAEAMEEARYVKKQLENLGISTFLCSVSAGGEIDVEIARNIRHCELVIIFGTDTYGAQTSAAFNSKTELQYIKNNHKPYFLIKMCTEFQEDLAAMYLHQGISHIEWPKGAPPPTTLIADIQSKLKEVGMAGGTRSRSSSFRPRSSSSAHRPKSTQQWQPAPPPLPPPNFYPQPKYELPERNETETDPTQTAQDAAQLFSQQQKPIQAKPPSQTTPQKAPKEHTKVYIRREGPCCECKCDGFVKFLTVVFVHIPIFIFLYPIYMPAFLVFEGFSIYSEFDPDEWDENLNVVDLQHLPRAEPEVMQALQYDPLFRMLVTVMRIVVILSLVGAALFIALSIAGLVACFYILKFCGLLCIACCEAYLDDD
eukprot:m.42558 g.42558  ORF g.42558 m.42558 type:complete len:531 (+) comp10708_c0_seq1:161-1753(+)